MAEQSSNLFVELLATLYGVFKAMFLATLRAFIPAREKSVAGRVVLLTGGGSGIGRLMAVDLARRGATIVSWDINKEGNGETARLVEEAGSVCHTYTVDISKREIIEKYGKEVERDVGNVDILINNAGIISGRKFMDLTDEMITKTFEVNLFSHFWTVKTFLPTMINQGHGHIVNIASVAGLVGTSKMVDYCATKFADVGFTEALGHEMVAEGHNVNVTTVCPYFIDTGMFDGCINRFPRLLPTLDPKYTAQRIVKAILTNQKVLYIPRAMYILAIMKSFLPVDAFLVIHKFLGASNFMDKFVGREKKD